MKCLECGTELNVSKENYRYRECGLNGVTLLGVEVRRCPSCGNYEIALPGIEGIHRRIAHMLIEKMTRFTGEEVRFLRKSLGWSGSDFAKNMGVTEETVSRWENDATPIGPQADRLLRLMVAYSQPTMAYPTERLAQIDTRRTRKATAARLELDVREPIPA